MRLIIFGPPGSGKGTYASRLGVKLKIVSISMGDLFRESVKRGTDLGKKVAEYLDRGELVPDGIVTGVLKERINAPDSRKGFILDGYPRTVGQAKALDEITGIDAIIHLIVPEWIIIERLSSRRVCRGCGAIYNVRFLKPKREGVCDRCGGRLYQREDDKPEVIKERLKVYERQTQPIINYYRGRVPFIEAKCESVDIPPETVVEEIMQKLKRSGLTV